MMSCFGIDAVSGSLHALLCIWCDISIKLFDSFIF